MTGEMRRARVAAIRNEALGIRAFDLVPADGRPFPPFAPGAHIDLRAPDGQLRQYSLCGEPHEAPDRYTVAVKHEAEGRGASRAIHAGVAVGSVLVIGEPRNNFALAPDAARTLFIAGGIGITPIVPMIRARAAAGAEWTLHYCARSRRHAAFHDALAALAPARVRAHFADAPGCRLDVAALLREHAPGTHLYCCGPERLMTAVADASRHWPAGHVHFEWFHGDSAAGATNAPFEVELARSGRVLAVPPDRSILEVAREAGVDVPSACHEGVCGTCETAVLGGVPEHRDKLLSEEERAASRTMMICVSRAKNGRLVLDL
jgi:vanillate O-demethylase ferredoxin subunit